jgi:hypothetical protein
MQIVLLWCLNFTSRIAAFSFHSAFLFPWCFHVAQGYNAETKTIVVDSILHSDSNPHINSSYLLSTFQGMLSSCLKSTDVSQLFSEVMRIAT